MCATLETMSKSELISIILRKDSVEQQMQDEIKNLNEQLEEANSRPVIKEIAELSKRLNDFEDACDEYASVVTELTINNKILKTMLITISTISIVCGLLGLILNFGS
jgi:uncharacterized protein involved in exopolysaccharide biosynthesis